MSGFTVKYSYLCVYCSYIFLSVPYLVLCRVCVCVFQVTYLLLW